MAAIKMIDKRRIKVDTGLVKYTDNDNKTYYFNVWDKKVYIPYLEKEYNIINWANFISKTGQDLFIKLNCLTEYEDVNQIVIALRDKAVKVFGEDSIF